MRIIGGKHKSRLLKRVDSNLTRETADMVRQAVFNMLEQSVHGNVLDLYAGSGSYGLEAISRGADIVYFVDHQKKAVQTIIVNLTSLRETEKAKVIQKDAISFLNGVDFEFDYVFIDPPYDFRFDEQLFSLLKTKTSNDAYIVYESKKSLQLPNEAEGFLKIKDKTYGIKRISIYQKVK